MTTPTDSSPVGGIPLSPRVILHVTGEDRVRFLNGQVTNDVRNIPEGACLYAAVLNAKGKLDSVCHIRATVDGFLIDAHPSRQDSLLARLDRYLIADEVTLSDVSDQWHLTHLLGIPADDPRLCLPSGTLVHENDRYGCPGLDLLSPSALDIPEDLLIGDDALESFRISQGVPAWPSELTPGLLAPEAGLDQNAISYEKGCYLGQEVISRVKRAGKTNRHLVLLEVPAHSALTPFLNDDQPAGEITSVSTASIGDTALALGFRSRKFETNAEFQLPDGKGSVKVLRRLA